MTQTCGVDIIVGGGGDIFGVITVRPDIGGMPGGGVSGKGAQPGQASQTLHVQTLEGQDIKTSGRSTTTTVVYLLGHEYTSV